MFWFREAAELACSVDQVYYIFFAYLKGSKFK